jgi:hypothetical protein
MNAPTAPDDSLAAALWDYALRQGSLLWYLTWFGPADPANWQEQQLWQTASFVREQWIGDHRALLFDLTPPAQATQAGGWRFGAIQLDAYGYQIGNDGVRLSLVWSAQERLDINYSWFVHLLDPNGQIVAQQDRPPQGGYAPTGSWTPGAEVTDHLFFPRSDDETEVVQIRMGFVDPATGQPLSVFAPDGQRLGENYVLLSLLA